MSLTLLMLLATVAAQDPPPPRSHAPHGLVYFEAGSAMPRRPRPDDAIAYHGSRAGPNMYARVRGHTDTVGDAEANLRLSRQRAYAVADLLVQYGANPDLITIEACGEGALSRSTLDEVDQELNRLVWFDFRTGPNLRQLPMCVEEPYLPASMR